MSSEQKLKYAISLLKEKAEQTGRLPKKSDFPSDQVCLIKQKLGPWPRALEQAGLKPSVAVSAKEKSRIRRAKLKKKLKKQRKSLQSASDDNKADLH